MLPEILYTVSDIKRHAERLGQTHWFDRGSMRWFNSRLSATIHPTGSPYVYLFVSSERCDWNDRREMVTTSWGDELGTVFCSTREVWRGDPRLYSVRSYDLRSGSVDTIGEFQGYATARAAHRAAAKIAPTITATLEDWQEYAIAVNDEYDRSVRRARHFQPDQVVRVVSSNYGSALYLTYG